MVVKVEVVSGLVTGWKLNTGVTVVVAESGETVNCATDSGDGMTVTTVVCTRYDVNVVAGAIPLSQLVVPF